MPKTDISEQAVTINGDEYSVAVCVLASRNLKPFQLDIKGMYLDYHAPCSDDFLDFIEHIKRVKAADLDFPIIISPNGVIVDGRHRLAKALLDGNNTIKVVQLEEMPTPISTGGE